MIDAQFDMIKWSVGNPSQYNTPESFVGVVIWCSTSKFELIKNIGGDGRVISKNHIFSQKAEYSLKYKDGNLSYVAKGVRNTVGFDFHPVTNKLYFTDNGRDWLGDDSPSCELNRLDFEGQFFGYPFKHASDVIDPEFGNMNPGYDFVDPILELGAHVAPTGVSFYDGDMFPANMRNNLFIALHGSWNRTKKVGYKLIRVQIDKEGNVLNTSDFVSGWLRDEKVSGRPSAPIMKSDGSLLLSDDKANVIYRITYK